MRQPRNLPDTALVGEHGVGGLPLLDAGRLRVMADANLGVPASARGTHINFKCDEPEEPAQSDLAFRLKVSTELNEIKARISKLEAAPVARVRLTKEQLWPGGLDAKGEPLLNKTNDAAAAARINARKL